MSTPVIEPVPVGAPTYLAGRSPDIVMFTIREAPSLEHIVQTMRYWIADTLVPYINENVQYLSDEWEKNVQQMADDVAEAIAGEQAWVTGEITELTNYVNEQVQLVIENSITVQDPVVAGLATDLTSDTSVALGQTYVEFSVETETGYVRPENAVSTIFIGDDSPGATAQENDLWANPDDATMSEVIAEVNNPASPLGMAVRAASVPTTMEITALDLASVDNRPVTLSTVAGSNILTGGVPVLHYPDAVTSVAGCVIRIPQGWTACRAYVDWAHYNQAPGAAPIWQLRLNTYQPGTDISSEVGVQVLEAPGPIPAVRQVARLSIAGNFTVVPGALNRLAVLRRPSNFGTHADLIQVILERTA